MAVRNRSGNERDRTEKRKKEKAGKGRNGRKVPVPAASRGEGGRGAPHRGGQKPLFFWLYTRGRG